MEQKITSCDVNWSKFLGRIGSGEEIKKNTLTLVSPRYSFWITSKLIWFLDPDEPWDNTTSSGLHPGIPKLARIVANLGINVAEDLFLLELLGTESTEAESESLNRDLHQRWRQMETSLLFNSLAQCKRVLMPQKVAEVFARKLKREESMCLWERRLY